MYPGRTEDRLDLTELSFLTTPLAAIPTIELSRGLVLRTSGGGATLHGGQSTLEMGKNVQPGYPVLVKACRLAGVRFLGFEGCVGFVLKAPYGHAIGGEQFVEALIRPTDALQARLRVAAERATGSPWSDSAYDEALFILTTLVGDGHLDAEDLDRLLVERSLRDAPTYRYAFYYANVHVAIEDMRTVLLRAMNRFSAAIRLLAQINQTRPNWHEPLAATWEIRHSSPSTQALYDAYVDCTLACSSTLDLLFKVLAQTAIEPLGNPASPGRIDLPLPTRGRAMQDLPKAIRTKANDLGTMTAPYALSNLGDGAFFGLKAWRNELTHNLGPVAFDLPVYVGSHGAPVNGLELQYAQFMAPDLRTTGELASHDWVPRLYKQRRDALDQLHGWLEETVLAVTDTLNWIVRRLDHRAASQRPS